MNCQTHSRTMVDFAAFGARMDELTSKITQLRRQSPDMVKRVLALVRAGDAIEMVHMPTDRANEFTASLHFTDALLALVPALRTGDADA